MPTRLDYRQQLLETRCRELRTQIDQMRQNRESRETKQPETPAPSPPEAQTRGGKWFRNGDRLPAAQDMTDPQKLKEMLNELSRHTEVDYNSGRVNWK